MTVDEMLAREAIRDTLARYNIAGDRMLADDFLAVFTSNAVIESGSRARESFRYEGLDAIRTWTDSWRAPRATTEPRLEARPSPRFVRHHLSTSLIEIDAADTASARTYWTVFTQIGADHGGYYLDMFRKAGARWLISHRRVRVDWHAPNGLFRPADWQD